MADVSAVTASACTRLESFRFEDEDDTRTSSSQFQVVRTREPTSFWRENLVAVVSLLRVLARKSLWQKQVIKC